MGRKGMNKSESQAAAVLSLGERHSVLPESGALLALACLILASGEVGSLPWMGMWHSKATSIPWRHSEGWNVAAEWPLQPSEHSHAGAGDCLSQL